MGVFDLQIACFYVYITFTLSNMSLVDVCVVSAQYCVQVHAWP